MVFNSFQFAIFFPLTTITFFAIPHRFRWFWLLLISVYFYMSFIPEYILILAGTIVVDYVAGLLIDGAAGTRRKTMLVLSIVANLGVLFFFKYFNFFSSMVDDICRSLNMPRSTSSLRIILPLGLSFHTFQSMSYTIEVYRGNQKPERHFGIFALYVLFYPQLVAGPIERPQNMLSQFYIKQRFEYQRFADGMKLMTWGFIKKMVIADRIAPMVNTVYDAPDRASGVALLIATLLFAYQIYCDFSGYSDIARGSAQVMGFRLMNNFSCPYASRSLSEFWRRWHISLSTWFRDYLYIPLGGSLRGWLVTSRNLLIVFLLSGLWHGANWTFVVWGAIHGGILVLSNTTAPLRKHVKLSLVVPLLRHAVSAFQVVGTFLVVSFAWVFFRARTLGEATTILRAIYRDRVGLTQPSAIMSAIRELTRHLVALWPAFFVLVLLLIGFELVQFGQRRSGGVRQWLAMKPSGIRWGAYGLAIAVLMIFSETSNASSFIYFQF